MNNFLLRFLSSIILIPVSLFIIIKGGNLFLLFILFLLSLSSYECYNLFKKNTASFLFGLFFLLIAFYSAYILRGSSNNDLNFYLFIILICISTDIGGYIFGKTFKGPKLTKISPKKTISGSLGSFIFSFIAAYIFIFNTSLVFNHNLYLLTFIIALISQIGDLTISYFKRKSNVKDSGGIIPGHGGLLDRLDGMIFVFPIINFLNI